MKEERKDQNSLYETSLRVHFKKWNTFSKMKKNWNNLIPKILGNNQHTVPLYDDTNLGFLFTCSKHWMTSPIGKSSQYLMTSPQSMPFTAASTSCFSRFSDSHIPSKTTSPLLGLKVADLMKRPWRAWHPTIFTPGPFDLLHSFSSKMFKTSGPLVFLSPFWICDRFLCYFFPINYKK